MAKKRGRPKKAADSKRHELMREAAVGNVVVKKKKEKVTVPVPVKQINEQTLSALVLKGDLSGLNAVQKMEYYMRLCEHLHLDPVTRPFDIINIRGREVMYAHKGCTDQLRKQNGVSITDIKGEQVSDVYRVTAIGQDKTGRTDAATGVVNIGKLAGDELANALMKAETKAKRRLTLSLCGLGMLDETEIETIPGAAKVDFTENGKPLVKPEEKIAAVIDTIAVELAPENEEVKQARLALSTLYKEMKQSSFFSAAELEERKQQAVASKANLNSLIDLKAAWQMELNERRKA